MNGSGPLANSAAFSHLVYILIVLICIGCAWYGIQQIRLELFLKNPKSAAGKLLQIFASIALGYGVARFIIDYFNWSFGWTEMLKTIF